MSLRPPVPPGATIGMLGGGQLGRMAALAAAPLGLSIHIYTPVVGDCAIEVSAAATIAAWNDWAALDRFAASVDAVTLEFENVPLETVAYLARLRPMLPDAKALAVAQDRIAEKSFLNDLGIATAPWAVIASQAELAEAVQRIPGPAILKTTRLGYDGKGQVRVADATELAAAWDLLGGVPCILESHVDFTRELSTVLARGQDGEIAAYPVVENRHENGILAETIAPAHVPGPIGMQTTTTAIRIAEALDYVGVLAVEYFAARDGRLLVNEIAPRPHNSGHWTIDACACSQFEQQIRAIAGWKLGSCERYSSALMKNLIGNAVDGWRVYADDFTARLHLYGKPGARPGRKMGHVTWLEPFKEYCEQTEG